MSPSFWSIYCKCAQQIFLLLAHNQQHSHAHKGSSLNMSTTSRSAPSCQPCSQQFRQQVQVLTPLLPAQQHHQQHQQLRLPSRRVTPACRASSHQQQQQHELTSLSQHNINASTGTSSSSRRRLLLAMASSLLAAAPMLSSTLVQPAQAYLVDETAAQSVFALASRSVVSINDYSTQGDGELLEGVGTGFVWSRYGHGECCCVRSRVALRVQQWWHYCMRLGSRRTPRHS